MIYPMYEVTTIVDHWMHLRPTMISGQVRACWRKSTARHTNRVGDAGGHDESSRLAVHVEP